MNPYILPQPYTHKPLVPPVYAHIDIYMYVDKHYVDLYIHVFIPRYEYTYVATVKGTPLVLSVCAHIKIYIHVDIHHANIYTSM